MLDLDIERTGSQHRSISVPTAEVASVPSRPQHGELKIVTCCHGSFLPQRVGSQRALRSYLQCHGCTRLYLRPSNSVTPLTTETTWPRLPTPSTSMHETDLRSGSANGATGVSHYDWLFISGITMKPHIRVSLAETSHDNLPGSLRPSRALGIFTVALRSRSSAMVREQVHIEHQRTRQEFII